MLTDGSLNDGRTVIGIGLEDQSQDASTHGEREGSESACNHAPARRLLRPTRRGRRSQESGIVRPLRLDAPSDGRGRRNVTNRRQGRILRRAYRRATRGEEDGRRGRVRDTHDNLQTTVSNICSSNTCTIACTAANVETHSNICFILRVIGLKLTHPVDSHPCTSASTPTKEGP